MMSNFLAGSYGCIEEKRKEQKASEQEIEVAECNSTHRSVVRPAYTAYHMQADVLCMHVSGDKSANVLLTRIPGKYLVQSRTT